MGGISKRAVLFYGIGYGVLLNREGRGIINRLTRTHHNRGPNHNTCLVSPKGNYGGW